MNFFFCFRVDNVFFCFHLNNVAFIFREANESSRVANGSDRQGTGVNSEFIDQHDIMQSQRPNFQVRQESYTNQRQDSFTNQRPDGFSNPRQEGFANQRQEGFGNQRQEGFANLRQDSYPPSQKQDTIQQNAAFAQQQPLQRQESYGTHKANESYFNNQVSRS